MNNFIAKISGLTRKQRLALLLILGLLVLLYISLRNVGKKQEIRPMAAGSGEVDLRFDPSSGTKAKNETFKIDLKVFKTSSRNINTSGAQAVINIDPKFTINSATCEAPFNGLPIANISGSTVTFICGTALGIDPVALDAAGKSFASVNVTVKSDATDGAAPLSFTSTRVTEAGVGGQAPDVSTAGQNASITIGTVTVSPTPSTTVTPTPSPTGGAIVGLWHMDEASGNVVDSSGNGNTGIPTGTTVVAGKLGNARSFNGSTDYISIADSNSLNPSAITAEAWIKTTDTGVSRTILVKSNSCSNVASGYIMWLNEGGVGVGKPGFFVGSGSWVDANTAVNDGLWHYLAATYDGTEVKIYIDGVLSISAPRPGANLSSINPLQMGGSTYCGNAFNGTLDEVHISNYALSASEILANYQAQNVTPTPSPTVVVSETPVPSLTPTGTLVPTITLTPTPPSGQEAYTIDIGDKNVLSINIGAGNTPQIKFTAKLAGAEGHPDMYFKLRAKDDLAFLNNPNAAPTCESPGAGGVDLYVPMKADNSGVYSPVTSINLPSPAGAVVAIVTSDGWVSLAGLSAGKYYTLNLKGPKTRGTQMLEHVLLVGGQDQNQIYDWTGNNIQLQPGDLPDPNNSNKQDCTVNSVDISLINSRLGKTDPGSLNIADVSYDGVVNANDIAQVVGTLSTKPDDDN